MLELVGVSISGVTHERLNRVTLTVRPGEVLGLVGPSGAGKSTVLALMAGALTCERGRLTLDGREVSKQPGRLRACAGHAGEAPLGPVDVSVQDWLRLWGRLDGLSSAGLAERVAQAMTRFALAPISAVPVSHLARVERNRVRCARLWVRQPRLYLIDAADDALDPASERALVGAVRAATGAGASVVLELTREALATTVCDRVVALDAGAVAFEASRADGDFVARVATGCRGAQA